ncbi:probable carboxypeptidase [Rhynchosporium graminicola]|uniref:Probable carboxypeptidase n=1 Tax=Rhynchosporium graminicola TaxID=2792576 RepID=A0A1E1LQJ2_9HELO|nr:probable carboxypeptidase [Rhynchosporium commune]
MKFASVTLLSFAAVVSSAKVSYNGAKAFRIPVGEDVAPLMEVIHKLDLPIWKGAPGGVPIANSHVDLVVPAKDVKNFQKMTSSMVTEVMHEDLGASIDAEGSAAANSTAAANLSWFDAYHEYADHITFLNELVALNSTQSEIVIIGTSSEGRPITGIHFWGASGKGIKPAIILHGTVHAREWITTMTTEYLAYYLLQNYGSSAEIKFFVDKYDFYIFPVVNPDGFVYTQTTNRLWRKSRQVVPYSTCLNNSTCGANSTCVGRDINRNWPFQWDVPGGASSDPCSDVFKGFAAGDATENKILVAHTNMIKATQGLQLYIDIHSYSQLFMTPYGYSCTAVANNSESLNSLAAGASAAIHSIYGTNFTSGPICSTIYQATGTSVDYINDVTKSNYTFVMELRDTGTYGFVLPADQILPTSVETYAGLRHLLLNMV